MDTFNQEAYQRKFNLADPDAIEFFVQNGFLVYENLFDETLITKSRQWLLDRIAGFMAAYERGDRDFEMNRWSIQILEEFKKTENFDPIVKNKNLTRVFQQFLGPDVALFNSHGLWINTPTDKSAVSKKPPHVDAWTGTSVNTLHGNVYFTDVDEGNSVYVCPKSHLQGLMPVRERGIEPRAEIDFDQVVLHQIKAGDVWIFHSLLTHGSCEGSDTIRVSISSRFTSTESPFSSQERALGYRTLSVGPLNQILRVVGSDLLAPLRTYGGHAGVDETLRDLYTYTEYRA